MPHPLEEWLGYRDVLPLHVEPLLRRPDEIELQHWQEQNLRMFAAVAILDERCGYRTESGSAEDPEIERLHQKIDLVLDLLVALVRRNDERMVERSVRLSGEGLSWPVAAGAPPEGSCVTVELQLHGAAPQPLRWLAEVIGVHDGEVCARFSPMSDACSAALERHVFTRHRRSVAGSRLPAGKPASPQ